MAHREQREFCIMVKRLFPEKFKGRVLDVGSLDINGSNRYLFKRCKYLGIDLGEGKNVDLVYSGHEFSPLQYFDIVISTEALEHDQNWKETIKNCIQLTKSGGLLLITCASTGRQEHGTEKNHGWCSPFTSGYYKNISVEELSEVMNAQRWFSTFHFQYNPNPGDLYFFGIKK